MPTSSRCPFPHTDTDEPASPTRRALFRGAAIAGGAALIGGLPGATAYAEAKVPPDAIAAEIVDPAHEKQPFYGPHQSGVVNPAPAAGLAVSFNVLASDRNQLSQLFQILTKRFAFLTQGGAADTEDAAFPPPDSGILGPEILPNNLTATLAVGASLFDERFGLGHAMPRSLTQMTAFPNDRLDGDWCHGDLLIQFCSNSQEANIHALRDIIKNTPSLLMVRWKQDGFLPESATRSKGKLTPRNLLGFKDGTANPDAGDGELMRQIVWVQPGSDEPAWTIGGTYQVVRIIRMLVEQWDRTPLAEQEGIVGRHKASGAPMGMDQEHATPDFAGDPKGRTTRLDAHIRLANPRTSATEASLILRRGYNYSRGANKAGQLDMGLLFNCSQSNLGAGFMTVQQRLNGEPFEEYIKPTGGGYFFALPGIADASRYLGQSLLEAASA